MSPKASQVLLSLLLARYETQFTHLEFAVRAGLGGESIPLALRVSEQAGLITIVAQGVKPADKEIVDEIIKTYTPTAVVPILPDPIQAHGRGGSGVGDRGEGTENTGRDHNGKALSPGVLRGASEADQDGVDGPLVLCRRADESGRRTDQIKALQAAWAEAFPIQDYEYQQLQVQAAKHFLVGRSAEEVGEVILAAPKQTREHIEWPRAYVEKMLKGKTEEPTITDELRELAKLAKEQIRARKAADQRSSHEYGAS